MGRNSELAQPLGVKFDDGKSPVVEGVFNYFPNALKAVAQVSEYGTNKYNVFFYERSWIKVPNGYSRYTNALGRHLLDEAINPVDEESKLLHAQMAAWNALARLEILMQGGPTTTEASIEP